MTEANENQLSLDGASPSSSTADAPASATAKKSPRRKVAVRAKVPVTEASAGAAGEIPSKVRRPRRKASEAQAPEAAQPPAAQAELLPPAALSESPDPQAHVETKVIPPKVMAALEEKTAEIFGKDSASQETALRPSAAPEAASSDLRLQVAAPVSAPDAPAREVHRQPAAESRQVSPEESTMNPAAPAPMPPEVPAAAYQTTEPPPLREQRDSRDSRGDRLQSSSSSDLRFGDRQRSSGGQQQNYPQQQRHQQQQRHPQQQRHQPHHQQSSGGQPHQQQPPPQNQGGGEPLVSRPVETQYGEGIIEVSGKGFGFLREAKRNFVQTPADIFVTPEVCRKYNLRDGQWIKGEIRRSSRGPQMFRLTALNGEDPEKFRNLPNFDELTTISPLKRIKLETVPERYTTRVMDLMTPIGKGQRGLIVAPPRTGKTTLLQHIAESVVKNHPEMKLIILLVDERPEEVTEIRRTVPQAEIMASSNDSDLKSHTRIAQLAMERAKRLVEANQHVFILLDSITRMARAFNNAMSGGRATQSGGLAVGALEIPRKIFAAARNTEEAGSLTIMATALIETNSKMDDAIFQEFKGTGNMELVLDRKISDQRIYPAVDIFLSGTRREELLLQPWELDKINVIRRGLAGHKPIEAIERLLSFLKKFPTNAQMLASLPG
jgi:transcription termination factor Rho